MKREATILGRKEKQLERLKAMPKDFTFDEARALLESFGYMEFYLPIE